VALAGTADRGADAAVIIVRPGAVSGAAVGASAAGSAAAGVEFEGKVKVEECPARVPQRGTRDPSIDGGMAPESGPAVELPAEISFAALSAGLCGSRPLAAADSPLVGQRSSISGCFALFMSRAAGALGRKPRRSGGRRPRRRAFHETGRRGETHSRNREA